MSGHVYESAFAADIEGFVAFKADMGIASASRDWHLRDFDRWCAERGAAAFDRDTVEGWVRHRKERTSPDHQSWMSHVRELGRWMRANGTPDAYVLSDDFRSRMVRVRPFLITASDAEAFFAAAAAYDPPSPMAWEARCMFGLMHSCGLRTCEVRRLGVGDVDPANRRVDVLWSKGNRSRRLAVTGEVADMLDRCGRATAAEYGGDRAAFFVGRGGGPVSPALAGTTFARIWDAAGLPRVREGRRVRPYDLRHRFAYANIERWWREGLDVMSMVPYLSRYMGHASFDSTLYYVHTSPDFMSGFAGAAAGLDALLPEVGFDA